VWKHLPYCTNYFVASKIEFKLLLRKSVTGKDPSFEDVDSPDVEECHSLTWILQKWNNSVPMTRKKNCT
jgi:hypothetical protein